ncbi:uncharacterized protein PRCAT00004031001 [Priceomyces carsonii]|uniref:uncharacterized protein n=1 Tax=Priceomyces carsonii TaxID=28549 RepID=UPI002EDB397B|nr:unnamed protein product [Priceomyces carsonii]
MLLTEDSLNHQHVIRFKGAYTFSKNVKTRKLSRRGCYNCKKKKIKCDERKPYCTYCTKRSISCTWPHSKAVTRSQAGIVTSTSSDPNGSEKSSENNDSSNFVISKHFDSVSNAYEGLMRTNLVQCYSMIEQTVNETIPTHITFSHYQTLGYYSFVDGVLKNLATSYYREKISLAKVLEEQWNESTIMREIFFTCGFAFLLFEGNKFPSMIYKKYLKTVSYFIEVIKSGNVLDDFLLIEAVQVLQFLTLKDFFVGSLQRQSINHLIAFYNLLLNKIQNMLLQNMRNANDVWKEVLLRYSFMRPIMEIFLINYSFLLLFCDYDLLDSLIHISLEKAIFFQVSLTLVNEIEDNWFDEEVFRITNESFLISSRLTWILRKELPLSEENRKIQVNVLNVCTSYLNLLLTLKKNCRKAELLRNILKGCIVLKSCIIIYKKICNPHLQIGEFVDDINDLISYVSNAVNDNEMLPVWCLFIGALSSKSSDQRLFFRSRISEIVTCMRSYSVLSVLNWLDKNWQSFDADVLFNDYFSGRLSESFSI